MYPFYINICIHPLTTFISILFNSITLLTFLYQHSYPSFLYKHLYLFYINICIHPLTTFISILFNSITLLSFLYQHSYPSFLYKHICIHSASTFVSILSYESLHPSHQPSSTKQAVKIT